MAIDHKNQNGVNGPRKTIVRNTSSIHPGQNVVLLCDIATIAQ